MYKLKFILFSLLGLSLSIEVSALQCRSLFLDPAGKPSYRFQNNEASHTLSQILRDNHLDFSYFIKSYARKIQKTHPDLYPTLMNLLKHKGWIAGDNHGGNYTVGSVNGKMKYYFADIKDGGYGPLFYNFVNLVLNTHAVTKRTDSAKIYYVADLLIETYLKGLKKERMLAPHQIREALQTTKAEYRQLQNEDVARFLNIERTRFNLSKPSLMPINLNSAKMTQFKSELNAHLQATDAINKVLDFAIRLKERGGSKDLDRYWALVELKTGDIRIIEFKEINLPAAQVVESSGLDLRTHTEKMMSVYFPETDALTKPVEIRGKLYMMRPRKVDLTSVPYKQKNSKQVSELLSTARYAAYHTGVKQSETTSNATDYIRLLEADSVNVQLLVRQLVKDYYEHLDQ